MISEQEGKGLLDTIAGLKNPVGGDVFLNGQNVTKRYLKPRVAYAQNNPNLCKALTAHQTLRFHYDLKRPTEKLDHLKIDANDRVSALTLFKRSVLIKQTYTNKQNYYKICRWHKYYILFYVFIVNVLKI